MYVAYSNSRRNDTLYLWHMLISGDITPSASVVYGDSMIDTIPSAYKVVAYDNSGKDIIRSVSVVYGNFGRDTTLFVSVLCGNSGEDATLSVN